MPIAPLRSSSAVLTERYQRLSTAVTDPDTGSEASFVVYPAAYRSVAGQHVPIPRWEDIDPVEDLGFEDRRARDELPASTLAVDEVWIRTLAAALRPELVGFREDPVGTFHWTRRLDDIDVPADLLSFATYLFEQPLIPFRRSPISGESLAQLVGRVSGAGTGGFIGAYAGIDHGLLVLLTAPGGMIVGGAAMGVATALEAGLHDRVLRLIRPPSPDDPRRLPSPPSNN